MTSRLSPREATNNEHQVVATAGDNNEQTGGWAADRQTAWETI